MKLPNGERAIVDVRKKLLGYCLDKSHRVGKHKAVVFESVLGITPQNAEILAAALRLAARDLDAKIRDRSADAVKYEIQSLVSGPRGSAMVRSGWVIERGTDIPRLTTCYVAKRKSAGGSRGTDV